MYLVKLLGIIFLIPSTLCFASLPNFTRLGKPNHINELQKRFKKSNNIRVRVLKSAKKVRVSGKNIVRNLMLNNDVKKFVGESTINFNCHGKTARKKRGAPLLFASMSSKVGNIKLNGEPYEGSIQILASKGKNNCDVVNNVAMEDYLSSLLAKEMNSRWHIEALKAQAVAARTYAIHKIHSKQVSKELGHEAHYDLESSEKHQVSGSRRHITRKTRKASFSTRGEILMADGGELTPIFFHAKCGGKTILPEVVWDNFVEGYESVDCKKCLKVTEKRFHKVITKKRFKKFVDWAIKQNSKYQKVIEKINVDDIRIAPDKLSYNSLKLYIGEKVLVLSKPLLRRYFGRVIVPSNRFKAELKEGHFSLKGKGNGHGVGMCQVGALDYAQVGWNYKQILKHYFPKHEIKKVY